MLFGALCLKDVAIQSKGKYSNNVDIAWKVFTILVATVCYI